MCKVCLQDFSLSYQTPDMEVTAIAGVNLCIYEGEFISIIGPSGCGKSTLLSALSGLNKDGEGLICIDGNVGYMPQQDCLFPWRTVMDNILLGPEIHNRKSTNDKAYALSLLEKYGLKDSATKYPSELSGGMRQRAALIRTLVYGADILLLDEAFSALDYQTRLKVVDDIYSIIRQEKKTALLVTHDISEAISVSDRVCVMRGQPGTITTNISVNYPKGMSPSDRRQSPDFQQYFHLLKEELQHEQKN